MQGRHPAIAVSAGKAGAVVGRVGADEETARPQETALRPGGSAEPAAAVWSEQVRLIGDGAELEPLEGVPILATTLFAVRFGFLIAAPCGYLAGLLDSSSSPISGIGILITMLVAVLLPLLIGRAAGPEDDRSVIGPALLVASVIVTMASIANDDLQDLKTGPPRRRDALAPGDRAARGRRRQVNGDRAAADAPVQSRRLRRRPAAFRYGCGSGPAGTPGRVDDADRQRHRPRRLALAHGRDRQEARRRARRKARRGAREPRIVAPPPRGGPFRP